MTGGLCIATPVYGAPQVGHVSLGYHSAMLRLARSPHVTLLPTRLFVNCDLVRARSRAVRVALEHGASHLLFWDEDVYGTDDAGEACVGPCIQGMLDQRVDFIAAPYARKRSGKPSAPVHADDGHVGMGFTLLSRRCMATMTEAYRETLLFRDLIEGEFFPTVALFMLMIKNGVLYGEDFSFCERWLALKEDVYLYDGPGAQLGHVGGHVFR